MRTVRPSGVTEPGNAMPPLSSWSGDPVPSAACTYNAGVLARVDDQMMRRPSGVQIGTMSSIGLLVSRDIKIAIDLEVVSAPEQAEAQAETEAELEGATA